MAPKVTSSNNQIRIGGYVTRDESGITFHNEGNT